MSEVTDVVIEDIILLKPDNIQAHTVKVLDQQHRVTCNKTTQFYMIQ
jgi:hypothetical protein